MKKNFDIKKLPGARKKLFPTIILPELCTTGHPPPGEDWLHEIKFDGYRIISFIKDHQVQLISRNEKDWTDKFGNIVADLKKISVKKIILDGEIVVLDEKGISRFQLLQNAFEQKKQAVFHYFIFDILYYENYDLTNVPLLQRKDLLKTLMEQWLDKVTYLRYSEHIIGQGNEVFAQACQLGAEGIVSKRISSPYVQYRSKDWIKSKYLHRQEFVIGGYTEPGGSRSYFGALLLGYYDDRGDLIYCGHVGTGFNQVTLKNLYELMHSNEQKQSPFLQTPKEKNVHWLKPTLVAEIEFLEWTSDGILRIPSFQGLREDKNPKDVKRETANENQKFQAITPAEGKKMARIAKQKKKANIATIPISNAEKLLYKDPDITKLDLLDYYEQAAKWILPHLTSRPLTILRCPNGAQAKCFFQKHIDETMPQGIFACKVKADEEPYIWIKDISGLVALCQMGVLEIHPWGSTIDNPDKPDRIIFDLDPSEEVVWSEVIDCALLLHERLQQAGLQSFVKTTGGKGLHIVVPLIPQANWDEIKEFSGMVADDMVSQNPQKYIATMSKAKRQHKIFIDYFRNMKGATAIAPYCTRALPGAPISTPVSWQELKRINSPQQFTLNNIKKRLTNLKKDPWQGFFEVDQAIKF